ncbi:hypothetical protein [Bdellovibrio sp. HCB337]|uniref:hypothetical protein n=1 Tax=Bdellovibrio sp. HCB337 TaxID=3394358 RepID=UPI0039A4E212
MIRAFMSLLVLSLVSTSAFAEQSCDTSLTLSCRALYRADSNVITEFVGQSAFTNDSCAAQVEIVNGNSTLQISATQNPENKIVTFSAIALHSDGQSSKAATGYASAGVAMNFGFLHLPTPLQSGSIVVRDALVGCLVR